MKNKVTVTGANKLFFIFTIIFLIFQLILGLLAMIYGEGFIDRNVYGVILVNEYILIAIPCLLYVSIKKLSFKEVFRINKPGIVPVILIAFISVPAYFTASMLNTVFIFLLQFIGNVPYQPVPTPQTPVELLVGIFILAVSPAICEEMLHRGIILTAYQKRGTMKAVVITSLFFGIFHFDISNLVGPIFLGFIIGYYVIRTNSIFAGVLAHFLNNTIAELLQFASRGDAAIPQRVTVSLEELGAAAIYGATGILILWLLIGLFKKLTEDKSYLKPPISNVRSDVISVISHWPVIAVLVIYITIAILTLNFG